MKTLRQTVADEPDAWDCVARSMALAERMRSESRLCVASDAALVVMSAGDVYRVLAVMWMLEAVRRKL